MAKELTILYWDDEEETDGSIAAPVLEELRGGSSPRQEDYIPTREPVKPGEVYVWTAQGRRSEYERVKAALKESGIRDLLSGLLLFSLGFLLLVLILGGGKG